MKYWLVVASVATAMTLTGCQDSPSPNPTETVTITPSVSVSSPSSGQSPSASASGSATPNWDISATSARPTSGSRAEVFVTAIRVGEHENFDRVVVDMAGGAASSQTWDVEYVADPITQGSGLPIDLAAPEYLMLKLYGMATPTTNFEEVPSQTIEDSAVGNIQGVYVDPPYEGYSYIYIGVDAQRDFRVTTMESPARIVIDIHK